MSTRITDNNRHCSNMDCGGKRSATSLWISDEHGDTAAKAPSPLRSAGALQMAPLFLALLFALIVTTRAAEPKPVLA